MSGCANTFTPGFAYSTEDRSHGQRYIYWNIKTRGLDPHQRMCLATVSVVLLPCCFAVGRSCVLMGQRRFSWTTVEDYIIIIYIIMKYYGGYRSFCECYKTVTCFYWGFITFLSLSVSPHSLSLSHTHARTHSRNHTTDTHSHTNWVVNAPTYLALFLSRV